MAQSRGIWAAALGCAVAVVLAVLRATIPATPDAQAFAGRYAEPLPPLGRPMRIYHLGHSLTGRDMPAMLAQLSGAGHVYGSQLGWGASLRQHWQGDAIPGFAEENAHPAFSPAHPALESGAYDAVVLTEMVEIRDAIRYHASADFLAAWARKARQANPEVRMYLYETWHPFDDPEGWLERLNRDLALYWEAELLRPAMARDGVGTIYVIPAGQVLARLVPMIEAGRLPGLSRREDLFARSADGAVDSIHLNDIGGYVVALTHYAVLLQRSPEGLPHRLFRADGSEADAPAEAAARIMQQVVWQVVTGYAATGVGAIGARDQGR